MKRLALPTLLAATLLTGCLALYALLFAPSWLLFPRYVQGPNGGYTDLDIGPGGLLVAGGQTGNLYEYGKNGLNAVSNFTDETAISIAWDPTRNLCYGGDDEGDLFEIDTFGSSNFLLNVDGTSLNTLAIAPPTFRPYGGWVIAGTENNIWAINPANQDRVQITDGEGHPISDLTITHGGSLFFVAGQSVYRSSARGVRTLISDDFNEPDGIAYDKVARDLLIADAGDDMLYGFNLLERRKRPLARYDFNGGFFPTGIAFDDKHRTAYFNSGTGNMVLRSAVLPGLDDRHGDVFIDGSTTGAGKVAWDPSGRLLIPLASGRRITAWARENIQLGAAYDVLAREDRPMTAVAVDPKTSRLYAGYGTGQIATATRLGFTWRLDLGRDHGINSLAFAPESFTNWPGWLIATTQGGEVAAINPATYQAQPVANLGGPVSDITFSSFGLGYALRYDLGDIVTIDGVGNVQNFVGGFDKPNGIAIDEGNDRLIITDGGTNAIYSVSLMGGMPWMLEGNLEIQDSAVATPLAFDRLRGVVFGEFKKPPADDFFDRSPRQLSLTVRLDF